MVSRGPNRARFASSAGSATVVLRWRALGIALATALTLCSAPRRPELCASAFARILSDTGVTQECGRSVPYDRSNGPQTSLGVGGSHDVSHSARGR